MSKHISCYWRNTLAVIAKNMPRWVGLLVWIYIIYRIKWLHYLVCLYELINNFFNSLSPSFTYTLFNLLFQTTIKSKSSCGRNFKVFLKWQFLERNVLPCLPSVSPAAHFMIWLVMLINSWQGWQAHLLQLILNFQTMGACLTHLQAYQVYQVRIFQQNSK